MLEYLRIVRGAVSKERLVPVLAHFAFRKQRVCGFDGRTYISAPAPDVPHDWSVTVPARPFLQAYDSMSETEGGAAEIKLTLTDDGARMIVHKGRSRVRLPVGPADAFPFAVDHDTGKPPKNAKKMSGEFLPLLTSLRPFIGEDASRPWSAAIKLQGAVAIATNNIALAVASIGAKSQLMSCVIPVQAIDELLRIDEEPTHVVIEPNAATFYLPGAAWLRTALLHDNWPAAMDIYKAILGKAKWKKANARWPDAARHVRLFCPDPKHEVIVLEDDKIKTQEGEIGAEVHACGKFEARYQFHAEPLLAVLDQATEVDFSQYPRVAWRNAETDIGGVLLGIAT